jgi:predicted Zn-dependent protease
VLSDPETGALALAKSKIALASFSRAQEFEADAIGVGMSARAGYDPYGAVRFLASMGRNAELKSSQEQSHIDPRAPDFLSSHPATPERIKNAQASARHSAPSTASATKRPTSPARWSGLRRDPSEVSCAAAVSCTPSSVSPSWHPRGCWTIPRGQFSGEGRAKP